MRWEPKEASRGDMVRIKIGLFYHYGVFVSEDEVIQFGYPPIPKYKNMDPVVVGAVDIDTFACEKFVEVAVLDRKERRERRSVEETVEFARSKIGEGGYNLIHNNCEHFAYECVFGVKRSTQEEAARAFYNGFLKSGEAK